MFKQPQYQIKRQNGFTLIELLTTVAIAGILAAIAVPSYRSFILTHRIKNASFDFANSMMLARSEAIKINATVNMVPAGSSWANGWCVYYASNTVNCSTGTGTFVQRHESMNNIAITGAPTTISYTRNGRLASSISAFNTKIASSQSGVTYQARCIVTDATGMPISKTISSSGSCP
ncbi:type IV fimbrial biogenesis protein FimT [Novimethylophilus kurashikiensis]|uniref:Type II secretion system protein H n=1 Tax=Novimethylophilus kurashikiensis TaxID=1825523 RepID=A0A2R5FB77_9PROT|nr:GspH/FimT family protein [Novimethylophilus kurashikiensis]GBG13884.1 type IV fimbrial biogenesis protein FimT [Novimethylophilus kurashikiensis]